MRLFMKSRGERRAPGDSRPIVAVTGAAGRVGRACLLALADEPVRVIAIDQVRGGGPGEWRHADLRRFDDARRALAGATHLIHLAGYTAPNDELGAQVLVDNVAIASHVLEAFVSGSPVTAVLASSVSVYGMVWSPTVQSPDHVPVDEDHPRRPHDPYSLSKVVVEDLAAMWSRTNGLTTVALRFPWTCGDEPHRQREFLTALAADPTGELGRRHLWCWIHVDDVAAAMVAALAVRDGRAHVLNIASDEVPGGHDVRALVGACHPSTDIRHAMDDAGCFDISRAQHLLAWQPTRSLPTLVAAGGAPDHG